MTPLYVIAIFGGLLAFWCGASWYVEHRDSAMFHGHRLPFRRHLHHRVRTVRVRRVVRTRHVPYCTVVMTAEEIADGEQRRVLGEP